MSGPYFSPAPGFMMDTGMRSDPMSTSHLSAFAFSSVRESGTIAKYRPLLALEVTCTSNLIDIPGFEPSLVRLERPTVGSSPLVKVKRFASSTSTQSLKFDGREEDLLEKVKCSPLRTIDISTARSACGHTVLALKVTSARLPRTA